MNLTLGLHHSTAVVHPGAVVPDSCEIGPYSIVDEGVVLGEEVILGACCHVFRGVEIGRGTRLFDGVIIGSDPQDKKYKGEESCVIIGEYNKIREYVTINKGTQATGKTEMGSNCLIMAYSHIAHDCSLGDSITIANGVQMGGHVCIGTHAVISGMTGIHQFTRIGEGAFIGGGLRVTKDILPFSKALGEPINFAGINETGMIKMGLGQTEVSILKKFFRDLRSRGIQFFEPVLNSIEKTAEMAPILQCFENFRFDRDRPVLL